MQRPDKDRTNHSLICLKWRVEGCCRLFKTVTFLLSMSVDASGAALWETRVLEFPLHGGGAVQWVSPVMSS